MFLKPFKKLAVRVLSGNRLHLVVLNPDKTLLLVFETLPNYCALLSTTEMRKKINNNNNNNGNNNRRQQ